MDFNKYDPLKKQNQGEETTRELMTCGIDVQKDGSVVHPDWMSSSKVILLVEYLSNYQDQGVILYERFGSVGLKFKPGISYADTKNGRAQIAMNMLMLLQDATKDLKAMIADGIEIPLLNRHPAPQHVQQEEGRAAGPSQRS